MEYRLSREPSSTAAEPQKAMQKHVQEAAAPSDDVYRKWLHNASKNPQNAIKVAISPLDAAELYPGHRSNMLWIKS